MQLLNLLRVYLPLAFGIGSSCSPKVPQLAALLDPAPAAFTSWDFYADALVISAVLFFGSLLVGLVVRGHRSARAEPGSSTPDKVYPLYGFHYWLQRAIARMTNIKFFMRLFGDSSYIVHYLRWLGYDLRGVRQTGSNFGELVKHDNPFLSAVGSGTMVADGLSIINADFSSTSFRLSRVVDRGRQLPREQDRLPLAGQGRATTASSRRRSWFPSTDRCGKASACWARPASRSRGRSSATAQFDVETRDELRRGLAAKNMHNTVTMALFLLVRWIFAFVVTLLSWPPSTSWPLSGALAFALATALILVFTVAYNVLVERLRQRLQALRPQGCSIYDAAFWRHERFWKMPAVAYLHAFNGTPFKNVIWRLLGVRIGRRVFDDGARCPSGRSSRSGTTARSTPAASSSATRRRTAASSPTASRSVPAAPSASAPSSTTA